jgi:hypothetical protein
VLDVLDVTLRETFELGKFQTQRRSTGASQRFSVPFFSVVAMSVPQSLPSFAQAFSSSSLSETAPISNALPPIQSRSPTKKRSRDAPPRQASDAHTPDATRQSPLAVRIKEEDSPPQSPPHNASSRDSSATPAVQPLSKKRRVTVSHGPDTSSATPIPISPVVSTFSLADDAVVRQKTLADQRRASMSTGQPTSRSPPSDQLTTPNLARIRRVSPTTISGANRCAGNAVASGSQATSARPLTPPPIVPQQPPALTSLDPTPKPLQPAATHSLPPPPISFARRRAAQPGGRKRKPADILISPRGAGPSDPLAPVIQSAPPVADPGRFPMAIPRLPLVLNNAPATRRVAGNVPPTPTRFSLQGTTAPLTARTIQSSPNLSVPIANTLVPPTPHALHHPGYTGDRSAFLAPFEVFYDALNDSKQLKTWLSDQLQKSNALMVSLKQQQEKMDEIVEDLVEKRTRVMREEITMLRQRMESLEEAVLAVRAEPSSRQDLGYGYPHKLHQNGTESYRFPERKPDTIIRVTSPGREQEHQPSSSPPVEIVRRLSVSTTTARPEPPQALHGCFTLGGGHSRGPSGSAKVTPPMRPQGMTARATDSRPASRLYYPGSYTNNNPPLVDGQTTSRVGDKS